VLYEELRDYFSKKENTEALLPEYEARLARRNFLVLWRVMLFARAIREQFEQFQPIFSWSLY
jgi:hypothetical protein